ncbi:porin family protein [Arsukibacterium sp.]|uniref:porin family protein n=1 Tax=Arsukibacterium sp. TaxID=1977258 RepID=UPI002FD9938B
MLKKLSCLALIAALSSMPALANNGSFYVGGQLGNTKLKINEDGLSESESFNVLSGLVGYQFNRNFALEARLGTGVSDKTFSEDGYRESISVAHQAAVLAKGIVPINDVFSLYGVAGFGSVKYNFKESGNGFSYSENETVDGLTAGVGAAFNMGSQWALTLEYLQLPDKKYSAGPYSFKVKTNSLSVGVNYSF